MPLYEYICNKCGNEFTVLLVKSSQKPICTAQGCDSEDVTKKLSTFSCAIPGSTSGSPFSGGGG